MPPLTGNPEMSPRDRELLSEKLKEIVGRLEGEANKRVGERKPIEERWLEDLTQYHGRYDSKTETALKEGTKSRLYINQTRPKTDAMSARLMDLLFPTDDKNWSIGPTPVPRFAAEAERASQAALALKREADEAEKNAVGPDGQPAPQTPPEVAAKQKTAQEAQDRADKLQAALEEGRRRSELMSAEIEDQLKESNYQAVKRDQIEDACKYGTGVTEGPVTGMKVRKGWQKQPVLVEEIDQATGQPVIDLDTGKPKMVQGLDPSTNQPATEYALQTSAGDTPGMTHIDLWSFFPDMSVNKIEAGQGNYVRHLCNEKQLRGYAKLPGFDKDVIRELLKRKPKTTAPSYIASMRSITGEKSNIANEVYHVWKYSGPLSAEDMESLARASGDEATVTELGEVDPLQEFNAIVWFCDGEVLKFSIYPMDSGECMYSVFNLVKDESSVFGFGMPAIIRDPQSSLNAAWRAMMDNAGLASGPQIIVNQKLIEPADGKWELTPRKLWLAKDGIPANTTAFDSFDIQMHQVEMANIITLSKQFIDDMASMPAIAQGEQGTGVTKTAQGMALLMNSTNVVFRRIVKNFDDDVTTPDIRRFYDWNMQFNPKPEIKGDYEVDARGSSVLLVREMQAQNLMMVAIHLGAHPVYGPMLRNREVLRKLFQAHMIPAADVVLTDSEIDAVLASAAAQSAEAAQAEALAAMENRKMDLEEMKIQADVGKANMQAENDRYVADMAYETAMVQFAGKMNLSLDQLEAKLESERQNRASKEKMFFAEVVLKTRRGEGI